MEAKSAKAATKVSCMFVEEMGLDQSLVELDEERKGVGQRQKLQMSVVVGWRCFGLGVIWEWKDSHEGEMRLVIYIAKRQRQHELERRHDGLSIRMP